MSSWPTLMSTSLRGGATLPVVPRAALLRLDLEDEPVDGDDPHRLVTANRCRAVGAGPPRSVADRHDAVGVDVGARRAHLADHPLAPDRRRGEAGPHHRR